MCKFIVNTQVHSSRVQVSRLESDENRIESISPQRRRAHRDDSSFFFAAETPAKKNRHALWARPDKYKQLTRSVRSFPFLPSQQKREKNVFLCDLCASSEAGGET